MLTRFPSCPLGVLVLFMVLGCSPGCERVDPNQELGQDWMDALNSHDPTRVVELMQPGALCEDPMMRDSLGPAACAKWLAANWAIWKDRVYITKNMLTVPNIIVIEWRIQQTHPSGKSVPLDGATILAVTGQRISGVRNYYSTTAYLQFVKIAPS